LNFASRINVTTEQMLRLTRRERVEDLRHGFYEGAPRVNYP
jgi:hypothetical protein